MIFPRIRSKKRPILHFGCVWMFPRFNSGRQLYNMPVELRVGRLLLRNFRLVLEDQWAILVYFLIHLILGKYYYFIDCCLFGQDFDLLYCLRKLSLLIFWPEQIYLLIYQILSRMLLKYY